jgi:hypothetical protein
MAALDTIFGDFLPSEVFMADQGRHFKNKKVQDFCDKWGTKFHSVGAYSPWINGVVEGMNKLLLYILVRLCTPNVGEDGWHSMTKDDLPKQWPKHFPTAIRILNNRILPSIKFTPKEILFGMPVNTRTTPVADAIGPFTVEDAAIYMAYMEQ